MNDVQNAESSEVGPYTVYADPRLRNILTGRRMHEQHKALLAGQLSWNRKDWSTEDLRVLESMVNLVGRLDGFRLDLSLADKYGIGRISADLPAEDNLTSLCIEHYELWRLHAFGIKIINIKPFVEHRGVPIFKGALFGEFFERETGLKRGIASDMYVVGRMDVQYVVDYDVIRDDDGNPTLVHGVKREGDVVEGGSHRVRTTLRKAKYTASVVASCLPNWIDFKEQREASTLQVTTSQELEEVDEIDDDESACILAAIHSTSF